MVDLACLSNTMGVIHSLEIEGMNQEDNLKNHYHREQCLLRL